MQRLLLASAIASLLAATGGPTAAQERPLEGMNDLTVFGGVMTQGAFPGDSLIPFGSELDDVSLFAAAYNRTLADLGDGPLLGGSILLGGEIGVAGRFGDGDSGEVWFGPSLRYSGINLGPVTLSAGLVAGLSVVTAPSGIERDRERRIQGDATVLYYLGPEISLRSDAFKNVEFVYRHHHRSGARNIDYPPPLGDMGDTSNSNLVGLRFHF